VYYISGTLAALDNSTSRAHHPPDDEGGTRTMTQATTTKLRPVPNRAPAGPMAQAPTTKLRPLHDRVLVRRVEEQDDKHGSIIIPDTAKEKPQEGKVIAIGTGRVTEDGKKLPLALKEGDRILFGKYSGSEVKLDGQEYLIMKEEDVLGIVGS
jgi:chaperonin GroES